MSTPTTQNKGTGLDVNEGTIDRGIRIIFGLALLSLTFFGPKTAWGFIGIIPFVTGLFGYCPLYAAFGLSTCPIKK